jgi:hypothetical protein
MLTGQNTLYKVWITVLIISWRNKWFSKSKLARDKIKNPEKSSGFLIL